MPRDLIGAVRRRAALRTRLREQQERWHTTRKSSRYARRRQRPVETGTVFYESFFGNGMLDNPEAIFRHLLTRTDLPRLRHVWALDDLSRHQEVQAEFAGRDDVSFVRVDSLAYWETLAKAQYVITNQTLPQLYAKRDGQVYLNTWHGVPIKHMGRDMAGVGRSHSRNVVRNFLNADYLVSTSPYMTDTMYRHAYRLQGIYRGTVLEMGQPRMDLLTAAVSDPAGTRATLEAAGLRIGDRKVVLFAPTWRGKDFGHPEDDSADLLATVARLQEAADDLGHVVLLKVHQAAYELVRGSLPPGSEHVLVPNDLATNTVLGATDLLVSDYSSIVIDFLVTGRPVVHYVPDLEDYSDQRGLYLTQDELPGPVVADHDGLVAAVTEAIAAGPTSPRSQQAAARFSGPADGRVSARIVDVVFGGASADAGADYVLKRDFVDPAKERLLIHCGSMKSMGITTSALNLLRNLDYDKYDVTVFWPHIPGRDRAKNIAVVDDRARPLPRALTYIGTRRQVRQETDVAMQRGAANRLNPGHDQFWRTEWQRVFGDARFDHLIDFSGYGCYSPFVFSATEATHRSIWLHSEMVADLDRVIEKHEVDRLSPVFTTYRFFDHLVSVSPQLRDINRLALAAYAPPEKFHYALNTIDGDHILELSTHAFWGDAVFGPPGSSTSGSAVDDDEAAAAAEEAEQREEEQDDPEMGETPTTVQELESAENREGGVPSPEDQPGLPGAGDRPHRLRPVREPGTTLFITVGRLSLEKNHVRLVDAFARVHADHPDTRLWIVGGGKLEGTVRERITHHGLDRVVHMTGQVANPYKFMAKADCFVLSSDYEGQPVVILEARVLGLPVISTAFASVGDSIPDGAGLVVPQSVDGVADGMERFLAGEVHAKVLDHHDYNRRAIEQFERAIHGRHGHDDDED